VWCRAHAVPAFALAVLLATRAAVGDERSPDQPLSPSPGPTETDTRTRPRLLGFFLEEGALLGFQTIWYWTHIDFSGEDLELQWDLDSWRRKLLTFDIVRFDTNGFYTNTIAHGLAGTLEYQAARANGFGVGGATLVGFAGSVLWEYVVEYRERPSLNDLIVNTAAGIGIGEPLYQIARALRKGRPTPGRWLMALGLSPVDGLNGWIDKSFLLSREPSPWLRDRLWAGGRFVRLAEDSTRAEASAGLELELADRPGYGLPGAVSGRTHAGAWSALEARLDVATGGAEDALVGAHASTRTSLFGRYDQDIADAPTGSLGWGRFVGANTGFEFDARRLSAEWDRLGILHLVGPGLGYDWYLGPATLRWLLLGYGDFAMVQALVFGPTPSFTPTMPPTSALRAQGYYFGYGATLETRLRLDFEGSGPSASLALRAHHYWSIDGVDRTEVGGDEDPHGVQDDRAYAHLELGVPFGRTGWGVALAADLAVRRGTWADEERSALETSVGLFVTVVP
jgi:uncharacterized protein DUF3943